MNIGIVGLGLIGGSLGLDWVKAGHRVLGVSRQQETCQQAEARHAVHHASTHLESWQQQDLDLVVVCTPIPAVVPTIQALAEILPAHVVMTDVASVKGPLVRSVSPMWSAFLGGHPMAGTHETGIQAAVPGLFQGRPYVLTPQPDTLPAVVETVSKLVSQLGADLVVCDPEVHDAAVAWISHLPVMVSASLIAACRQGSDLEVVALAQRLASSGFRDTSRVGGGNPELGLAMAQYNREALLTCLKTYRHQLDQLMDWIESQDWDPLQQLFQTNQQERPRFLKP